MYYYVPKTGRFEQRARSVARSSFSVPRRSSYERTSYDDEVYIPSYRSYPSYRYDTTGNDYYTSSQVNKELLMSSAAMEDNYDLSSRSRQRDQDVMNSVNKAIAATELYSSPRASVATRRAMRGQSTPPGYYQSSANISKSESVQTKAKAIQDVDGPRRPNIMSWQYRIDAYTPPDDLVFYPRKLSTVKNQVLELKAKLDHHKQLMDRYLVTDTGLSADDMRVVAASKAYLGSRA